MSTRTPENIIEEVLDASRNELIANITLADRIMRALKLAGFSIEQRSEIP